MDKTLSSVQRRGFLRRAGAGLAGIGAVAGGAVLAAQAPAGGGAAWHPARHDADSWLDAIPGSHRFVLDTISLDGFGTALFYVNNFYNANQTGYGLGNADLAVVIIARHESTPFAYNEAMWAKYGEALGRSYGFTDPKTKAAPTVNLFQASGYGADLTNNGVTIGSLVERGTHFGVCQLATRRAASIIGRATGQEVNAVVAELTSNLVPNAHMVPAGIVAIARAQEHGYAFSYVG